MKDELNKVALLSGKMNGTKTIENVLGSIESPDDREIFLKEFVQLTLPSFPESEVIYINDNSELKEQLKAIDSNESIGIHIDASFSKIYLNVDDKKTLVILTEPIDVSILGKMLAKERILKFSVNTFKLVQWCILKKIEVKNIYDIPICMKILTNEEDPVQKINQHFIPYEVTSGTTMDEEVNMITMGQFANTYGRFLYENIKKFDLDRVYKLIYENSYNELLMNKKEEKCVIKFGYSNLKKVVENFKNSLLEQYEEKAYILSPLRENCLKIW